MRTFNPAYSAKEIPFTRIQHVVVTALSVKDEDKLLTINVVVTVYNDSPLNLTDAEALRFLREYVTWSSEAKA